MSKIKATADKIRAGEYDDASRAHAAITKLRLDPQDTMSLRELVRSEYPGGEFKGGRPSPPPELPPAPVPRLLSGGLVRRGDTEPPARGAPAAPVRAPTIPPPARVPSFAAPPLPPLPPPALPPHPAAPEPASPVQARIDSLLDPAKYSDLQGLRDVLAGELKRLDSEIAAGGRAMRLEQARRRAAVFVRLASAQLARDWDSVDQAPDSVMDEVLSGLCSLVAAGDRTASTAVALIGALVSRDFLAAAPEAERMAAE